MAVVGAMAALRILLIKPILNNTLSADAQPDRILVFKIPHTHWVLDLQRFVPHHLHNAWSVVAYTLVVSAVVKSVCDYAGTYLVNYAGFGMVTDLRNDLYSSILGRSVAFFQRYTTGSLISALINDVDRVQTAMSSVLGEFLQQIFTLLFLIIVVFIAGGKFAWILLLFIPVIISSARRIGKRVRSTTRSGQDKLAEIQNILQETITGNRIVKAFGMELWELTRFRKAARRLFRANLKSVSVQSISSPLMDALGSLAIALLLLLGRQSIVHGGMTLGDFVTFIAAVFTLYDPVRKFAQFYNSFQQALGASEQLFHFFDMKDELPESPDALILPELQQEIHFQNVGFSYQGGDDDASFKQVLSHIDLQVKRGEVIAFVGPSGAGKSTLVNLIPRFFDVTTGSITMDGIDLRRATLSSVRQQMATVTQETVLFNDTVRNNIAYGQPNIPLEEVKQAAMQALAHDFIERMPEGYNTVVGEKGFRLSGGERQRLAIARAILKNAPILILDEATSALDAESEALVQAALGNLMQDRTVFVIAHRLSTIRRASRIAVIDQGTIVQLGTHAELLQQEGLYQRLYQLQMRDDATPEDPGEVV